MNRILEPKDIHKIGIRYTVEKLRRMKYTVLKTNVGSRRPTYIMATRKRNRILVQVKTAVYPPNLPKKLNMDEEQNIKDSAEAEHAIPVLSKVALNEKGGLRYITLENVVKL